MHAAVCNTWTPLNLCAFALQYATAHNKSTDASLDVSQAPAGRTLQAALQDVTRDLDHWESQKELRSREIHALEVQLSQIMR